MRDPLPLDELTGIAPLLTEEECLIRRNVRRFVEERYLPKAAELFENERFPEELVPAIAELGLLGASLSGYGCAAMSSVGYGLSLQELEYGDSALRSFASVQGSLCMYPIHRYGSPEQRERWLPLMQQGKSIGCFGLTEHESGSDPASMKTRARKVGGHYVLNGAKMWITNAPIAHIFIVWAKVEDGGPESVRGFVIERDTKGLTTHTLRGKMSLRASPTGEVVLEDCAVPEDHMLPLAQGLSGPLSCLLQARYGISWGALGAARACYDCVVDYVRTRSQFGKPLAHKQLIQAQIVEMGSRIALGELLAFHMGRLKDTTGLSPAQVSLCKKTNVKAALDIARTARGLLGANGVLVSYPPIRHMLNLESVSTYEGTDEVHTLILGRALLGVDAF